MKTLKTLIEHTFAWAHNNDELAAAYMSDYKDFQNVANLLSNGSHYEAADIIDDMDTEPREAILAAIAKDLGEDFVERKLGWLV